MCDALIAMPDTTRRHNVVFAKNSDRPVDDCQVLQFNPASSGQKAVQCSYKVIESTGDRLATLGCRPYWSWGYETGINEAGVVGGNTAVFTRSSAADRRDLGLTGMELLRFGLEHGETADGAVRALIELLEIHGQWGSGMPGVDHDRGSYDNAFLIADRHEAFVVETSGRRWVVRAVADGVHSISNELTIRENYSQASSDLTEFAREHTWWDGKRPFDFALAYSAHESYPRQVSHIRRMRSQTLLERHTGTIDVFTAMTILRDHLEDTFLRGPQFTPFLPDFHTLCMHQSPSGFTWGNTATSMVVELDSTSTRPPIVWFSYLPPCSSVFMAYHWGDALPEEITRAGTAGLQVAPADRAAPDGYDGRSLWWRLRRLVDAIAEEPQQRQPLVRSAFDILERELMLDAAGHSAAGFDSSLRAQTRRVLDVIERYENAWQIGR